MTISKTFEPVRPLRCRGDHAADYHMNAAGIGRTYYGESHWPSCSYSQWHDTEEGILPKSDPATYRG